MESPETLDRRSRVEDLEWIARSGRQAGCALLMFVILKKPGWVLKGYLQQ